MDIYGYPSYQYGQPDELAKQMLAQQALGASAPFAQPAQPSHVMPMPLNAPWNSTGLTWGMQSPPQVVQFTANAYKDGKFNPLVHNKRKSLDLDPGIPAKQLITEEKMAAHLSGLHISSQYTSHTVPIDDVYMDTNANSIINVEKLKGHTIVLSDEIKKIKDEPLLPASLIERLEKPSMSLVIWTPRENLLENIKEQDETENLKEEEDYPRQRNGILVADDIQFSDDIGIDDVEM